MLLINFADTWSGYLDILSRSGSKFAYIDECCGEGELFNSFMLSSH
jgi:hypothetical protein